MSFEGQNISHYRLTRLLSKSKCDEVYQAEDTSSSTEVMIKLVELTGTRRAGVHEETHARTHHADIGEEETRARRIRERVKAIYELKRHPRVVPILEYGEEIIAKTNFIYVATPAYKGGSLEHWWQFRSKTRPLTKKDATSIMLEATEAVEHIHKHGIAHLNIKPSSLMLETRTKKPTCPHVFLNDFLLADPWEDLALPGAAAFAKDQAALRIMEEELLMGYPHVVETAANASTEVEKEKIMHEKREERDDDIKLLAAAILAAVGSRGTGVAGSGATAIASSETDSSSSWRRRWPWLLVALLLLALLLAGSLCLLASLFFFGRTVFAFGTSSARVTIAQASYELTDSYVFTGVTRSLSQTNTQSITVPARGRGFIAGVQAGGTLTFHNTQTVPTVIPAGTVFTSSHGVSVVTNQVVIVGALSTVTVHAHAVQRGPVIIEAHDMHQVYRSIIIVDNFAAFTGGKSGRSFTTVLQSDIDNAANTLKGPLNESTLGVLQMQLLTNEQLVSSPVCKSKVTSDHQAYDVATSVTVTVTVTCTAESYNYQAIVTQAETMLKERAQTLFGSNYALTGDITTDLTHIATGTKEGTLITVDASGLWAYHFSNAHIDQLARLIAGKDTQDVQSILSSQQGVQSVSIDISGNDKNTLPANANSINIDYVTTIVPIKEGMTSSVM